MAHMAAAAAAEEGGALRRLFETPPLPLPEKKNPTLLEVLAACGSQQQKKKPTVDPASFTELFGELHFREKPPSPAAHPDPAASSWLDVVAEAERRSSKDDSSLDALLRPASAAAAMAGGGVRRSESFSSASLLLCTEGLGSESAVDSDDMVKDGAGAGDEDEDEALRGSKGKEESAAAEEEAPPLRAAAEFPPAIRSVGRGGRPSVSLRAFRGEGRFVLTRVEIPGKELLRASRGGGRLRLQFADAAEELALLAAGEQHEG